MLEININIIYNIYHKENLKEEKFMVEREVRKVEDIADLIYLVKERKYMSIKAISKASGVTERSIISWKSGKMIPSVDSFIKVLKFLNVEIVLFANEVEEKVLQRVDILNFICQISESNKLSLTKVATNAGLSVAVLHNWKNKNVNPRIDVVLKVLSVLDTKMVLRVDGLEDECTESESENTEEVETRDMEHGETEVSEFDMLILGTAEKALKKCNSLSEKERLYKVLQAFL